MNLIKSLLICFAVATIGSTAAMANDRVISCNYTVERREGCLFNDWTYFWQRFNFTVTAEDGSSLSLTEAQTLIANQLQATVNSAYLNARNNPLELRAEIVKPTKDESTPFATWFYHYERVTFGSGPQCLQISRLYSIVPESVDCVTAP